MNRQPQRIRLRDMEVGEHMAVVLAKDYESPSQAVCSEDEKNA